MVADSHSHCGGGSAVADVLVPPQNLGETSFAEQYPTSPLTTQSFQRPEELDYARPLTDEEWDEVEGVLITDGGKILTTTGIGKVIPFEER